MMSSVIHPLSQHSADDSSQQDSTNLESFDPYNDAVLHSNTVQQGSLLDHEETDDEQETIEFSDIVKKAPVPGVAGFLEMEDEPPRTPERDGKTEQQLQHSASRYQVNAPIQTKSGLLLTHRRISLDSGRGSSQNIQNDDDGGQTKKRPSSNFFHRTLPLEGMEYEHGYYSNHASSRTTLILLRRLLGYVQVWVGLSAMVIAIGTVVVVFHHMKQPSNQTSNNSQLTNGMIDYSSSMSSSMVRIVAMDDAQMQKLDQQQQYPLNEAAGYDEQYNAVQIPNSATVILRPLQLQSTPDTIQSHHSHHNRALQQHNQHRGDPTRTKQSHRRLMPNRRQLWSDFKDWAVNHNKSYPTRKEMTKRFAVWRDNHQRTAAKNERHGPCQLTGQPVFGVTSFSDLTSEEFKAQYLNAYNVTRKLHDDRPVPVMGQHEGGSRHADVRRRMQSMKDGNVHYSNKRQSNYRDCSIYDVSCFLRYFFETYVYGFGGTMEPAYDADSYPTAWDWRDYGIVTDVHSQGSCGACWAITATETVESAVALATGVLNDLSEHEVIVCTDDCQMCSGGWPQDAIDYVINNNGVPLESDLKYNADLLLTLTKALDGESDDATDDNYLQNYRNTICPVGGGGGNSHSQDGDGSGGTSYKRYGSEIKGYGYATDRCVCYTDGSGCDCDSQNEGLAVRNLATYGPAIVCVDASLWQDYSGGIITSDSGCSSAFMDVNHCVQAVGYAFTTSGGDGNEDEKKDSGDGGHSNDKGESQRTGYWIIRNQWSTYFGMNGYAYVAMGENTCGILNDMIQVYT
ncbi:hypothetical protein MPSEU_000503400 [Mayamaea pseudoterrestris]|nr:hypothetical protein MPSEU_000503400 [Mayamaea pseudoterrestris]